MIKSYLLLSFIVLAWVIALAFDWGLSNYNQRDCWSHSSKWVACYSVKRTGFWPVYKNVNCYLYFYNPSAPTIGGKVPCKSKEKPNLGETV